MNQLIQSQKDFFNSNKTKEIAFRKQQLKKLYRLLLSNEAELNDAIYADFKKSSFDNYSTELGIIFSELKHSLKKVKYWSEKKYVRTNIGNIPGRSYIIPEPLGTTLVIGAWNYPYLLSLQPAVSSIAAGNTVIIKPSELGVHTSKIIAKIINENFPAHFLQVVEGGVKETTELLKCSFDKIFYTGSSQVGKIIMKAAAEHLTPVTLELGGKSPAIVTDTAAIKMTAKRLVWGKFLNGGQTCVAPDYILVDEKVKTKLIEELKIQIEKIHGSDPQKSEALVRIINLRHFNRLMKLMIPEKIIHGGITDESDLFISPTLMDHVSWEDAVMKEEIFGPLLPILTYKNIEEAIKQIKAQHKPLALYLFTKNFKLKEKVFNELSFGGGALNDTIMQFSNPNLPFGGVGYSGMGNYHGEYGFKCFSHEKSIIHKSNWFEPFIKYAPYNSFKLNILKRLM
jgi:aldehyde dehydrogenase (NAD+)